MIISDAEAETIARLLVKNKIILFVGSGLSRQAINLKHQDDRLPLWDELANIVARHYGVSLSSFGGRLLDFFDSMSHKYGRRDLEDRIREAIPDDIYGPAKIHEYLSSLPWTRVYTTNYDSLMARALNEKRPVVFGDDFERLGRSSKLVHLHGTLDNLHTLTSEDYACWTEKHRVASLKLTVDGYENSFLFIGYSNSDPHFQYSILPIIKELKGRRGGQSFSWMWRPSEEQVDLLLKRDGVKVHPIEDDSEWEACAKKVVDAFSKLKDEDGGASDNSEATDGARVRINGYKLFYYRDIKSVKRAKLARLCNMTAARIKLLEGVDLTKQYGEECFKECSITELWKLERALECDSTLEYGRGENKPLAHYIEYYMNNWRKRRGRGSAQSESVFKGQARAVVFDFGGTLTLPKFRENTWERVWRSAGYTLEDASKLHHLFSSGRISHQEWCDRTCEKLKERSFSISDFEAVYLDVEVVDGVDEVFDELHRRGIEIYIVSGSLRQIIERAIGSAISYVEEIKCNEMKFSNNGIIDSIVGSKYDFKGKKVFIDELVEKKGWHPIEVVFVGNSLNDEKAALSGARTICVNPRHTHPYVESIWNHVVKDMRNLREILRYV